MTEKKKRTIQEIVDSKKTGEKMVYSSVPDYTSASWAEKAGVDVCVVGCRMPGYARWRTAAGAKTCRPARGPSQRIPAHL